MPAKHFLHLLLWITGFLVFGGCRPAGSKKENPVAGGAAVEEPLAGGYHAVSDDKEVRLAAEFAVREQSKVESKSLVLKSILDAQQQVVAGRNFRFTVEVIEGSETRKAAAVVFQGLDSSFALTSWIWMEI